MKKIISFLIFLIIIGGLFSLPPNHIIAADPCPIFSYSPFPLYDTSSQVTFTMGPVVSSTTYVIRVRCTGVANNKDLEAVANNNTSISVTYPNQFVSGINQYACIFTLGYHPIVSLYQKGIHDPICTNNYSVISSCLLVYTPSYPDTNTLITFSGSNVPPEAKILGINGPINKAPQININADKTFTSSVTLESRGTYTAKVLDKNHNPIGCPEISFFVRAPNEPTGILPGTGGIKPIPCKEKEPGEGIMTALGCIPTKDTTQFVAWLLTFAIGIGGGIAFLLIIFGAFQVITSSGNPERVKKGQELITSAIAGLIFIIFSLFLLKLIGVNILNIPGFGTP